MPYIEPWTGCREREVDLEVTYRVKVRHTVRVLGDDPAIDYCDTPELWASDPEIEVLDVEYEDHGAENPS